MQEHSLGKVGTCNLRINCGATSYTDMAMVIPPFSLGYRRRKQKGYELITFYYRYSTVVFNGKTGEPRFPAAPKGKGWTQQEASGTTLWRTPSASSSRDGRLHRWTVTCGGRGGISCPRGSTSWLPRSPTPE